MPEMTVRRCSRNYAGAIRMKIIFVSGYAGEAFSKNLPSQSNMRSRPSRSR
jgi:hypothetical protein